MGPAGPAISALWGEVGPVRPGPGLGFVLGARMLGGSVAALGEELAGVSAGGKGKVGPQGPHAVMGPFPHFSAASSRPAAAAAGRV